jgi:hypothetical protein
MSLCNPLQRRSVGDWQISSLLTQEFNVLA